MDARIAHSSKIGNAINLITSAVQIADMDLLSAMKTAMMEAIMMKDVLLDASLGQRIIGTAKTQTLSLVKFAMNVEMAK